MRFHPPSREILMPSRIIVRLASLCVLHEASLVDGVPQRHQSPNLAAEACPLSACASGVRARGQEQDRSGLNIKSSLAPGENGETQAFDFIPLSPVLGTAGTQERSPCLISHDAGIPPEPVADQRF